MKTAFNIKSHLDEAALRAVAPSIFAEQSHESRSECFVPIPTIQIVRELAQHGFLPVKATQQRTRDESRQPFTKHAIRFRHVDAGERHAVGDTIAEVVLKNGNDGSSAYDLMAGLFRIRCLNGMIAQTATMDSLKVRHSGDALAKVIDGTYRVLDEAQKALSAPRDWSAIQLRPRHLEAFAEAAHHLRFADHEGHIDTPITPNQLLQVRRRDDAASDLWTVTNVIQENVIRGGLPARRPPSVNPVTGRRQAGRHVTMRPVNGIDQDIRLNKALWILATKMAELA